MQTVCLVPIILVGLTWMLAGIRVLYRKKYTYYRNLSVGGMTRLDREGYSTNVFGMTLVIVGFVIFLCGVLGFYEEPNNSFQYIFIGGLTAGIIYNLGHFLGENIYRKQIKTKKDK